jgi:hypothetical protein
MVCLENICINTVHKRDNDDDDDDDDDDDNNNNNNRLSLMCLPPYNSYSITFHGNIILFKFFI